MIHGIPVRIIVTKVGRIKRIYLCQKGVRRNVAKHEPEKSGEKFEMLGDLLSPAIRTRGYATNVLPRDIKRKLQEVLQQ